MVFSRGGSRQLCRPSRSRSLNGQADDVDASRAVAGVTVVVGVADFERVVVEPTNLIDGLFASAVDRGRKQTMQRVDPYIGPAHIEKSAPCLDPRGAFAVRGMDWV